MKARLLFVTTGLDTGGAEKMLVKLLARLHGTEVEAGVISLRPRGPVSDEIEALAVPLWHLELERPWRLVGAMTRLVGIARRFRPDVLQGWMYHGNLAAELSRVLGVRRARVVFGIRQSLYDIGREKLSTRVAIRAGARCSGHARSIVYNSDTARTQHEAIGYSPKHASVIDNGFDPDRFRSDPMAYREIRAELGLAADTPLIGLLARHHPMKGHEVFLQAAAMFTARQPLAHFLLAGKGVTCNNPVFADWLREPPLAGRLHLVGERADVPRVTAALDIASSSSWGEAFPNAVGEAMSCAVPVVATDVGDVRRIVGGAGIVVSVGEAGALARAWANLLADPGRRKAMGETGRQRVQQQFSIETVARRYAELYRGVAEGRTNGA